MADPVILIPAYKPDERLTGLVRHLMDSGFGQVVVVDDGGGNDYAEIFDACAALGARVLRHAVNLGKGRALKTGCNEVLLNYPGALGVITADCDGQHAPEDVARVAEALSKHPDAMIIGARAFEGRVPFKSRAGNMVTRVVYFLCTALPVTDTQTGLRGLPMGSLPALIRLSGERYEWEMRLLMALPHLNIAPVSVPIRTIYINNNDASHFKAFRDAPRVYKEILLGRLRAFFGWALGLLVFALLSLVAALPLADATARIAHMAIAPPKRKMLLPAVIAVAAGCALTYWLASLGFQPIWAKLASDIVMLLLMRFAQAAIGGKANDSH